VSEKRLRELIDEATVDCHDDDEQREGLFVSIEENLAMPFETTVLGVAVTVTGVSTNSSNEIVAECSAGKLRQHIAVTDLPLPSPPPEGYEWILAYERWASRR
jgi:hypothetical protein